MAEDNKISLRDAEGLSDAYEWVFNGLRSGTLESRTANAMTQTIKGATELRVKIPLKYVDMVVKARMKKIEVPKLPVGLIAGIDSE